MDLMTHSPAEVDPRQLRDLKIKLADDAAPHGLRPDPLREPGLLVRAHERGRRGGRDVGGLHRPRVRDGPRNAGDRDLGVQYDGIGR